MCTPDCRCYHGHLKSLRQLSTHHFAKTAHPNSSKCIVSRASMGNSQYVKHPHGEYDSPGVLLSCCLVLFPSLLSIPHFPCPFLPPPNTFPCFALPQMRRLQCQMSTRESTRIQRQLERYMQRRYRRLSSSNSQRIKALQLSFMSPSCAVVAWSSCLTAS